jgi:hypothetical protein
MNVAVIEPADGEIELQAGEAGSEWIDPEGDDWLASIYRYLTQEPTPVASVPSVPDLEHWFG